jgi:hypothetical protein
VAKAHGLIKDRDGERVLPVVVEDEEVSGHGCARPHDAIEPPPASEVHCARAVEEDPAVHTPLAPSCTRSRTCSCQSSTTDANLRGQPDCVLVPAVVEDHAELEHVSGLRIGRRW